jgi:hypothetical protein
MIAVEDVDKPESFIQEDMYKVYDTEECRYMDVRELEKDIYVTDAVTYFDKRQALKFTTISLKAKLQSIWGDFWANKDKNNQKLIKAAETGNLKAMRKVLNTFRKPEKIADVNFCGKNGLSALHVAVKAG